MRKLITIATAGLMVLSVAGTALAFEPETSPNLPGADNNLKTTSCLLYTSPSPRDRQKSRMPSSA